jgi:hypothetical protein
MSSLLSMRIPRAVSFHVGVHTPGALVLSKTDSNPPEVDIIGCYDTLGEHQELLNSAAASAAFEALSKTFPCLLRASVQTLGGHLPSTG